MATAARGPAAAALRAAPSAPTPAPGKAALPVEQRGLLTIGVMLATLMQILDSTIANVALPHMQTSLSATADTITWVLTSYIIASAVAIPVTGWLSDRIGSRNLFLVATGGFIGASMLCGLANSLESMVAFRVLQGIFAAFMNPLSQTVMLDINPPERQAKAMSIWGMGIMVGPIMGPMLGGWLTDNYNWRWVFYVNLPFGIICFAILWFLLPSRPIRKRSFDGLGFSLLSISIASLQLMLDRGQTKDWFQSGEVQIEGLLALICGWMFVTHVVTAKRPMFDRELLKNRNLLTGLGFMLVIGLLMMATMALLPPMLQRLFGYSVLETGILLMPRGVGVVISMFFAAQFVQRGGDPRILVGTGLAIAAGSLWQMTHWTLMMGTREFVISGLIQGLGLGMVFMPLNAMAFGTLPPHYRTEGASLVNLGRNIGAAAGISAVTALLGYNIQASHQSLAGHVTAGALSGYDTIASSMFGGSESTVLAMADAEINRQAAMIAYLDDFKLMMIMTLLAIPLVFLLERPARNQKVDPAHAVME